MPLFVPLHVYSSYSFLSSGFTIDRLISACKNGSYQSVGLTDRGVLFGFPEFVQLATKYHINPILGIDVTIDGFLLTVFAKDEAGYRWLVDASSRIQQNHPLPSFTALANHGIIVLSPHLSPSFQLDDELALSRKLVQLTGSMSECYIGIPLPSQVPS